MGKKICCIGTHETESIVQELIINKIYQCLNINIIRLGEEDSVLDYDVILYIHTKEANNDKNIQRQLKEGSDLNKTFLPIVMKTGWFSAWCLKHKYVGPDLRRRFYQWRKQEDRYLVHKEISNLAGCKVSGDAYGQKVLCKADLDCYIYRNDEIIAEQRNGKFVYIILYKGKHHLKFQSVKYPELTEDVTIKIEQLIDEKTVDVTLTRHREVERIPFKDGYYKGILLLEERDGAGTFWFSNGNVYTGNWSNDVITGHGRMEYPGVGVYEGDWQDGCRHGKGTMTWSDNNVYKGEWKHDQENGRGTRNFPNGTKYVGDWVNGERNGLGVEYDSSGEINYEGEWINGKKMG